MIKKTLLGILITTSFCINASEYKINCNVNELNQDKEHFCVIKEDKEFYLKEVFNIHNNADVYEQYKIIQKINNIPEELFNKKFNFVNENGLAVIMSEDGYFYTTRVGYVQKNGHYLEIKNNMVEEFKLEEIKNVKKFISKYNFYALDKDNQLWRKYDSKWSKIDIKNVYDFVYNEEGLIYILSEEGVYYGKDTGKLIDFKLMEVNIEENLYKNKMTKEKYKEYVFKSIFNDKTKFQESNTHLYGYDLEFDNNDFKNKDFYHYIENNKILIKEKMFAYDVAGIEYRNSAKTKMVTSYDREDRSSVKTKYSFKYKTYFITIPKNTIETKYNGNVFFYNKEDSIIESAPELNNPILKHEIRSNIVIAFQSDSYIFNLRDNGMLTITNIENGISKEIYNVERIKDESYRVKILIDPKFESYYDIDKFEVLDIEDIDEDEEKFVFKFKDFESLEHENIKEKLEQNN